MGENTVESSFGQKLVWCFGLGFLLQFVVPVSLNFFGFKRTALWSIFPGLYPVLIATHGWFASVSPMGVVLLFGINTLVYAILVLCVIKMYSRLKRHSA